MPKFNEALLLEMFGFDHSALWGDEHREHRFTVREALWREETRRHNLSKPVTQFPTLDPCKPYLVMVSRGVEYVEGAFVPSFEQITVVPPGSMIGAIGKTELPWYRHSGRRVR